MSHVTIPDQDSYVTHSSQTGTGPYNVPFAIFEKADLTVEVGGIEISQSGFSYTATSSTTGGYQTGTITLSVAAAAQDVTIYRRINPKRTSDLGPGPQPRDALNSSFDRVHAQLQDNRRDLDRALKLPFGEMPDDTLVDDLATIAGIATAIEDVADIDSEVVAVAAVASDVSTVATVVAEIVAIAAALVNSALVGALAFITPGRNAARNFFERFAERVSASDFITDARGGAEEREKLLLGTSTTYQDAAVAEMIAWAKEDSVRRVIDNPLHFVVENDIADIHEVRWAGRGSIRIQSGPKWFFRPDTYNSSFSLGYQNLYVSAAGNDANSGLSSAAPMATMNRAMAALSRRRKPLQALHRILVADGVYTAEFSSLGVSTLRDQQLYIQAATTPSTHDNTAMPPKPTRIDAITSASPPVVTDMGHPYSNGQKVFFYGLPNASGAHDADGKVYTIGNVTANTYELTGINGSAWAAYTGAGDTRGRAAVITGSRAGAIFYGAGRTGVWGAHFNAFMHATVSNLTFAGWGAKSRGLNVDEGALRGRFFSNIETSNIHVLSCTKGQMLRDLTMGIFNGGYSHDCAAAFWMIHSRGTVGVANGSYGDTTSPVIEECTVGVDLWEGNTTHVDCTRMINVDTEVLVRKGAHAIALNNDFLNYGPVKTGMKVQSGGHLGESGNVYTGGYQTPVLRQSGATLNAEPETLDERIVQTNGATLSGTTKATLLTTTIPQDYMSSRNHRLRATLGGTADNASSGTITFAAELDGNTIVSWSMAGTGARSWECEFEIVPYGIAGVTRAKRRSVDSINGAGILYTSPTTWSVARNWKTGVRAATTVAGTLATSFEAGDTIDGVVLRAGDRILIKDQVSTVENGIYVVQASGAPVRATDVDSGAEIGAAAVAVGPEGTTNKRTEWVCDQASTVTVDTDPLTFTKLLTKLSGVFTVTAVKASGDTCSVLDATLRKTGW